MSPATKSYQTYDLLVADALLEDDEGPSEEQLVGEQADVPDVHLAIFEEQLADGPLEAALGLRSGGR